MGQVPALVIDGHTLADSVSIVRNNLSLYTM